MTADTTPESLTPEQWREDVLGVIRSVAGVAKNYDEGGRSSMPITLDEAVALLYAANQYLAVTDPAALAAHDEEVARKALTDAADWLDLDPASALWEMWNVERAEYSTPTDALRARAEQIGENRG